MERSLRVRAGLFCLALPCLVPGLVSCASSGSSTSTTSSGGVAATVNICEAWLVWTPQQKQKFMDPIWNKVVTAVEPTLKQAHFNERQIATFNACWWREMPAFSGSMDKACAAGAVINSEKFSELASQHVPGCVDQASAS